MRTGQACGGEPQVDAGIGGLQAIFKKGKFSGFFSVIGRDPCKNFGTLLRRLYLYFGTETVLPAQCCGGNLKIALMARCQLLRCGVAICILNNFI